MKSNTEEMEKILLEKNIKTSEDIIFDNNNQKLKFLNKLDELEDNNINLEYLNNDITQIILEIEINNEIIEKLKKFNWNDLSRIIDEKDTDKRKHKIYLNFIHFLKTELNLIRPEKPLYDKQLINENLKNKDSEENITYEDISIYEKKENFDVEKDVKEKAQKFNVEIKFDYNEPTHKLTVNDFTLYFNRRLSYFTKLLEGRVNLENVTRINRLRDLYGSNTEVSIIGLVADVTKTKNGHYMITLEDKSGEIKCFVNKDKVEMTSKIEGLCLDEGIAIRGKIGDKILWSDEIVIPSPPNTSVLKKTHNEEYVAFISDIHFGAEVFVDDAFQRFVDFMNSQTKDEKLNEIAKKIKYIIVGGDVIEGIGIYPNQGKDARIKSSELQYHEAARWFSQIPKDKCFIIIPGNHDSNRLSEPQPKLPYKKAYSLYNMPNTIMLSNPSIIRLFEEDPEGGLEFYLYHGGSIFYYADKIQFLREKGGAKAPEEVIKFLLEKRHIAPSHGSTLYIPDSQNDPLVIKNMPDFFVVGHTHKMNIANYKGCTIFSCGCWVEMSEYQEKMGMFPDIGKCIIVNTKTRQPRILNFYKGDGKVVKRESSKE